MQRQYLLLFIFGISVALMSCKKTEVASVLGNQAPPDHTIENDVYENYITKTYILVLGREPDSTEFHAAMDILKTAGLSDSSRQVFLDDVFSDPGYKHRQYQKWNSELMNNLDTSEISFFLYLFDLQLSDTTYQFAWPALQYEKDRLLALQPAGNLFVSGAISLPELQSRMLNSYFYDQINMGALNFVVVSFRQLLHRNATDQEKSAGVSMVGGNSAVLLLQSGTGKDDYLNILTHSDDYYEGAIVRLYNDFLFRDPESLEMSVAAIRYRDTGDYEQAQKDILSTNEFIGIK
ncbi:MAG: hypothetical protein U0Y08_09475 [Bacteroidia bacterium]